MNGASSHNLTVLKLMKVDNKLALLKSEYKSILEWFAFVDRSNRIDVDYRLYTKIKESITEHTAPNYAILSQREVQAVLRWYYLVPEVAKDKSDKRIVKRMNVFIKVDGEIK